MTDVKPKSPKRISLGWLICWGMALGALLVPFAVYIAVGIYDTLYGSCALGPEDRLAARCGSSSSQRSRLFPAASPDLSLPIGSADAARRSREH